MLLVGWQEFPPAFRAAYVRPKGKAKAAKTDIGEVRVTPLGHHFDLLQILKTLAYVMFRMIAVFNCHKVWMPDPSVEVVPDTRPRQRDLARKPHGNALEQVAAFHHIALASAATGLICFPKAFTSLTRRMPL